MNEFSKRFNETRKKQGISALTIRLCYVEDFGKQLSVKQYKAWESGTEEPPLYFIAWFCKKLRISSDYILGLSNHITSPSSIDEVFSDLTEDQIMAVEGVLNAFREYNAALEQEA